MTENQKLRAAIKAKLDLTDEIRKSGRPPHPDYWVQSLCEVEAQMREALNQPESAKPDARRIAQAIAPFFMPGSVGHDSTALDRCVSAVLEALAQPTAAPDQDEALRAKGNEL